MRKLLTAVAAALLLLIALPASPALALNNSLPGCASKSGAGYNVRVCAVYGWRYQNDGTGVHVENVQIYTTTGCGDLESQAFESLRVTDTETGDHRNIGDQFSCSVTWDLEINGPDKGGTEVITHGNANVDLASDFDFDLICTIRPNDPDTCGGQAY